MKIPFFSCIRPLKLHKFGEWKVSDTKMAIYDDSFGKSDTPHHYLLIQFRQCKDCKFVESSKIRLP